MLCGCKLNMHASGPYCDASHQSIDFKHLEETYKVGFNKKRYLLKHQVKLVHKTWPKLKEVDPTFEKQGTLLFERLFEADPSTKAYFTNEKFMQFHVKKVFKVFEMVVKKADEGKEPRLKKLAIKHEGLGLTKANYKTMEKLFYELLEEHIGEEFTPEVQLAYNNVWHSVADVLIGEE